MNGLFSKEACLPGYIKWEFAVARQHEMYRKSDDIRNEFSRDYNRILHCNAYRRLKHKTQVFYATQNDHICTRIEHVHHVAAISNTICSEVGLNTDLAAAIALGHDLGHAPFGHEGEKILSQLSVDGGGRIFWHEQNSLKVADTIETLAGLDGKRRNLNLTYAVRDGLISHCGEVDENGLKPRNELLDLYDILRPNQVQPYTWEACVVKIADKIAYLGRDIEDAIRLNILDNQQLDELKDTLRDQYGPLIQQVNTTNLVHGLIMDLVEQSNPDKGLSFSEDMFKLMNDIKKYNYKHIYKHPRLQYYNSYVKLIIESLFSVVMQTNANPPDFRTIERFYPVLAKSFHNWLVRYSDLDLVEKEKQLYDIPVVYQIANETDYREAILMFLAVMSDHFALEQYKYLVTL